MVFTGCARTGAILRDAVFPIGIENGLIGIFNRPCTAGKAVDKDMIHRAAGKPCGGVELPLGDQKSIGGRSCLLLGEDEVELIRCGGKEGVPCAQEKEAVIKEPVLPLAARRQRVGRQRQGQRIGIHRIMLTRRNKGKRIVGICPAVTPEAKDNGGNTQTARDLGT